MSGSHGANLFAAVLLAACSSWLFADARVLAQESDDPQAGAPAPAVEGPLGSRQARALDRLLVGRWIAAVGDAEFDLRLDEDGTYRLNGESGRYERVGKTLRLGESAYELEVSETALSLSGAELAEPLKFLRRSEARSFARKLFGVSGENLRNRFGQILAILVIVAACRLLIFLFDRLSHLLVFGGKGPLRYLYRRHKNRSRTLHAVALNVVKYVIYFTGLGFVLSELGVNYTTYLATLSVVGLAIAFGSQGLVQDVVTGFFIIFENQFDVGDMVEISGQTGIVEDFGLRMTRLRNYQGQVVAIPNRNIAVVGNFAPGGLRARVDVALPGEESAARAGEAVLGAAAETARQFEGVFLSPPEVEKPVVLETGECFARLKLDLWPGQQWAVEQQIVPRIKEALAREGVEIPGDRIAVFYHARKRTARRRFAASA